MIYIVIINILAYMLFGIDKRKAKSHQWRISEFTLFMVAGIGGSFGALLGMNRFHHKTKKVKFKVGISCICIVHLLIFIWFFLMNKAL